MLLVLGALLDLAQAVFVDGAVVATLCCREAADPLVAIPEHTARFLQIVRVLEPSSSASNSARSFLSCSSLSC
jgi:hypothetical protein